MIIFCFWYTQDIKLTCHTAACPAGIGFEEPKMSRYQTVGSCQYRLNAGVMVWCRHDTSCQTRASPKEEHHPTRVNPNAIENHGWNSSNPCTQGLSRVVHHTSESPRNIGCTGPWPPTSRGCWWSRSDAQRRARPRFSRKCCCFTSSVWKWKSTETYKQDISELLNGWSEL